MPYLSIGGRPDAKVRLLWTAFGGTKFRPSRTVLGSEQGSMLRGGAGVAYALGEQRDLQLGTELNGWAVMRDVSSKTTGLELLFSAKLRVLDDFEGGLGFGRSQPLESSQSPDARARNRRVDFHVVE